MAGVVRVISAWNEVGGTMLRQLGRNVEAAVTYEAYVADPQADPARAKDLERILGEIDAVVARLRVEVNRPDDIPGVRRCHVHDPFGKRRELIGVARSQVRGSRITLPSVTILRPDFFLRR